MFLSLVFAACGQEKSVGEISPTNQVNSTPLQKNDAQIKSLPDSQPKISPSETYRRYFEANGKGDIAEIKKLSSKKTLALIEKITKEQGISFEEMIRHQNSLIPADQQALEIRNEKIVGDRATMEISNPNSGIWIPTLLIIEDGIWKIGDGERIEDIEKTFNDKPEQIKKSN